MSDLREKLTACMERAVEAKEAVTLMFGYLFYKEVSTWENCVATYRNDRNTRMIINKMDEIIYGLERIEIAMLRGFDNISEWVFLIRCLHQNLHIYGSRVFAGRLFYCPVFAFRWVIITLKEV